MWLLPAVLCPPFRWCPCDTSRLQLSAVLFSPHPSGRDRVVAPRPVSVSSRGSRAPEHLFCGVLCLLTLGCSVFPAFYKTHKVPGSS